MNVANGLFMLPEDIVTRVVVGISDYNETKHSVPPFGTGSNSGSQECLARCAKLVENLDEVGTRINFVVLLTLLYSLGCLDGPR